VQREFLQRLCVALHGTFGSYLRDSLHKGFADRVSRALACGVFPFLYFPLFLIVSTFYIICMNFATIRER
jgi:hypothetical protein